MIPVADIVAEGATVLCAAIFGAMAIDQAVPPEAQGWTLTGLVAVLTVGIGGWLVKTLDKVGEKTTAAIQSNTEAQNKVATALALLTQRETDSQHTTELKRAEIVTKLDKLADDVRALKAS